MGNSTLPVIIDLPSDSLTTRTPGAALERVEAIAAIHALAEYFAEHPEVPVPGAVLLTAMAGNPYGLTPAGRSLAIERVATFAHRNDATLGSNPGDRAWTDGATAGLVINVPGPLSIDYQFTLPRARRTLLAKRYGGTR